MTVARKSFPAGQKVLNRLGIPKCFRNFRGRRQKVSGSAATFSGVARKSFPAGQKVLNHLGIPKAFRNFRGRRHFFSGSARQPPAGLRDHCQKVLNALGIFGVGVIFFRGLPVETRRVRPVHVGDGRASRLSWARCRR